VIHFITTIRVWLGQGRILPAQAANAKCAHEAWRGERLRIGRNRSDAFFGHARPVVEAQAYRDGVDPNQVVLPWMGRSPNFFGKASSRKGQPPGTFRQDMGNASDFALPPSPNAAHCQT
jgi:hypothetical protein